MQTHLIALLYIFTAPLLCLPNHATAQTICSGTFYVREGASGNGCNWTNAFNTLPQSMQRGSTYYVADGTYTSFPSGEYGHTLSDAPSGTQTITIKKATLSEHGTDTGWQNVFGDGQATLSTLILESDYWVIDGQVRDESNWANGLAYGFRIKGSVMANTANAPGGVCASNITVRYVDIGGNDIGNTLIGNESSSAFYIAGYNESCTNWNLQRNYVHNVGVQGAAFHLNGTDTGLIEYNWIGNSWGKEALRGAIRFSNYVIRHNVFKDSCQNDGHVGSGCTAEIAIWDGSNFNGNQIYGNIFRKTTDQQNSGGVIVVGGNGSGWVGPSASNTLVYNNTIVGVKGFSTMGILVNGGSGNICSNNLYYDMYGSVTPATSCNSVSSNTEVTTNPFINYSNGNLKLSAASVTGTTLSNPYNIDINGIARGSDGVWDIGAYEFINSANQLPAAPTNLKIQ